MKGRGGRNGQHEKRVRETGSSVEGWGGAGNNGGRNSAGWGDPSISTNFTWETSETTNSTQPPPPKLPPPECPPPPLPPPPPSIQPKSDYLSSMPAEQSSGVDKGKARVVDSMLPKPPPGESSIVSKATQLGLTEHMM